MSSLNPFDPVWATNSKSCCLNSLRAKFSVRVSNMNAATPMDMLTEFFELNPNFDDEKWMFLYAIFRSMHVKYGVDKQPQPCSSFSR